MCRCACARCKSFDGDGWRARKRRKAWSDFKEEREGDRAVAGARYGLALKDAVCGGARSVQRRPRIAPGARACRLPQPPRPKPQRPTAARSGWCSIRSRRSSSPARTSSRTTSSGLTPPSRSTPTPSACASSSARRITSTWSPSTRKVLPWLALGQNVQFVFNNTLYDIYE